MTNELLGTNRSKRLTEITKPKLLLGEGTDEVALFNALLAYLKIDDIQVIDYKGKHNIDVELATVVKLPGFTRLASIGITRDADYFPNMADWLVPENRGIGEAKAAFDSICSALRKTNLELPIPDAPMHKVSAVGKPAVSIFILPDCVQTGMLEDLCLQTLADTPEIKCVDNYFACITQEVQRTHPAYKLAKARIRVWLSIKESPDLSFGAAAAKGFVNFEHAAFDKLKQFLQLL